MVMRREIIALYRLTTDFKEHRRLPAITAKQRNVEAELFRLHANERALGIITGHEDAVGILRLDGSELCLEILVTAVVIQFSHDLAIVRLETLLKKFCQSLAIITFHIRQHRHSLGLESVACEIRHHCALKWINEAHTENVIAGFG